MKTVYILDLDFKPTSCLCNQYYCLIENQVIQDENKKFEIIFFNDRFNLQEAIKKFAPDILLFDLYSKTNSNGTVEHFSLEDESDDAKNTKENQGQSQKIDQIEDALSTMQKYRQYTRRTLKNKNHPTGIQEMKAVVSSTEIDISFPIAVYSRFGRQLISTEDMLEIQKMGAYFVWKEKSKSEKRYSDGFTPREQRSVYDVLQAYDENIARLEPSLLKERKNAKRIERKLLMTKRSVVIEYYFVFMIIIAALIHGEELFFHELHASSRLIADFLSFKYLSPIMIMSAIYYAVKIRVREIRAGALLQAYSLSTSIINDLIASRSVIKKRDTKIE